MSLDLIFPASGSLLPTDHNYPLYGALSGIVPRFHEADGRLRFAPITGDPDGEGHLRLHGGSYLRVRVPDDAVRAALPLAGKKLDVAGHAVRLGVPAVRTLEPAPMLASRLVTFKNAETPESFLATARKQLAELGVSGEPQP